MQARLQHERVFRVHYCHQGSGFAEDEYPVGKTTYVFLKVPISILMRLLQSGEIGALKQPTKEADVNEVIDAVGFDFILTTRGAVEVQEGAFAGCTALEGLRHSPY